MDVKKTGVIRFNGPASYKIKAQGLIPSRFFKQFPGFGFDPNAPTGAEDYSFLVGKISDQTQLTGVLSSLYSMHIVVLEVVAFENLDNQ